MSKKLRFYEGTHTYWYGKQKLESVTTFVHKFFEPFKAREIARKLAKFPANRKAKRGVRYWLNKWKASATHGTKVHKELEDYLNNSLSSQSFTEPKAEQGYKWFIKLRKTLGEPIVIPELLIFDEELGLAGTIDCFVEHNGFDKEGRESNERVLTLIDWKTNEKITVNGYKDKRGVKSVCKDLDDCHVVKYGLQLSTYAYILERKGYKIFKLCLAHLKEDGVNPLEIDYEFYKPYVEKMLEYKRITN